MTLDKKYERKRKNNAIDAPKWRVCIGTNYAGYSNTGKTYQTLSINVLDEFLPSWKMWSVQCWIHEQVRTTTSSSIFSPGGQEKTESQKPSSQFHSREKTNAIPGHLVSCLKKLTFYLVQGRKFHDVVERSAVKVHEGLFSRESLRHWEGTTNCLSQIFTDNL